MSSFTVPLFLRGEVITDDLVSFSTRSGSTAFEAPDLRKYLDRLPLASPMAMSDLYDIGFDEILASSKPLAGASLRGRIRTSKRPTRPRWLPTSSRRRC